MKLKIVLVMALALVAASEDPESPSDARTGNRGGRRDQKDKNNNRGGGSTNTRGFLGHNQGGFNNPGLGGFNNPGLGGFNNAGLGGFNNPGLGGFNNPGLGGFGQPGPLPIAVSPVQPVLPFQPVAPVVSNVAPPSSCRYWCRTPQGQAYCCESANEPQSNAGVVKQGYCPPVRPVCPPIRNFQPPATCSNDGACGGYDKCCFDTCLQEHICKPPQGFGR